LKGHGFSYQVSRHALQFVVHDREFVGFGEEVEAVDVLALIDSFDFLTEADKLAIVHDNPLRMFPCLTKTRALAGAAV